MFGKSPVSPKKKNHTSNTSKNSYSENIFEKKETLIPDETQQHVKTVLGTPNPQLIYLPLQKANETCLLTETNHYRQQVNHNSDYNKLMGSVTKVKAITLNQEDLIDGLEENQSYLPITTVKSKPRGFVIREDLYYLVILFTGFASLLGMLIAPELSRKLSCWAAMNPVKARSMIGSVQVLTGFAGLCLGIELSKGGTQLSGFSRDILITTFLATALLYPVRKSHFKFLKRTYFRQKIHDLLLFLTGFMLMVWIGNFISGREIQGSVSEISPNHLNQLIIIQKNEIHPSGDRALYQQALIQDEPEASPKKGLSRGAKIILTILACFGFCAAGFGVIAASCGLACSGLNALAYIVAIVGGFSVIALFYWALKSIYKPKKNPIPASTTG